MTGMKLWRDPASGAYRLRFSRAEKPPNGKLVSLRKFAKHTVYDKTEAERWFKEIEKKWLAQKLHELEKGKRITIPELIKEYKEARPDLSNDTLRMDDLALRSLGNVIGNSKVVRSINDRDLVKFKNTLLARDLSPHTVKTYFRHIGAAMNYAVENGYKEKPPKIPKVKTGKRLPKAITNESHREAILKWARENEPVIWQYAQFALWTGARRGECLRLRWQDVTLYDEPRGAVHGRAVLLGKGDKQRTVPLTSEAVEAMGDSKDIGRVFRKIHKDTISKWFHKVVVECGLDIYGYSFHSMRHTAATVMIGKGIHLRTVQKILGHVDYRTTEAYTEIVNQVVEDEFGEKMG